MNHNEITGMLIGFYTSEDPSSAGGQVQNFPIKHHTTLLEGNCETRVYLRCHMAR